MKRSLALLLLLGTPVWGALTRDLGKNLVYTRISDVAEDAAALAECLKKPELVLDLRNAVASPESASVLARELDAITPAAAGLRLILINAQTAPLLVEAVDKDRPRELTIGPESPALRTDISVHASPEDDRRGFDALAAGTPVDKLTGSNLEKRRFDESALAKNRSGAEQSMADEDNQEPPPELAASAEAAKKEIVPPHDAVLERAIQLARAMAVLRKQT